jgi:HSP20 family protein
MLTLYRPFTNLLRDEFGGRDWAPFFGSAREAQTFVPAVDVVEKDGAFVLKAEVPGLSPDQIDVQIENNVLSVRGVRRYENEEERGGYRRVERSYGSFSRSFVLPEGTNPDDIEAKVEHGILSVTIPKVKTAAARKVEVKGGGIVEKAKKILSKSADAESASARA